MTQGADHARERFELAFLATRYLLGSRGAALSHGLPELVSTSVGRLKSALCHAERHQRATRLAHELGRLTAALERARLRRRPQWL